MSIDPELTVLYATGSGSEEFPDGGTSVGYSLSGVRVLFSLGLSGWIDTGGAPIAAPDSAPVAEARSGESGRGSAERQ